MPMFYGMKVHKHGGHLHLAQNKLGFLHKFNDVQSRLDWLAAAPEGEERYIVHSGELFRIPVGVSDFHVKMAYQILG